MNTSEKHRKFITERVRDKPVTDIAGISATLGQRLSDAGYEKASKVVGKYMVISGNETVFKIFLSQTCSANEQEANDAYKCVKEYVDNIS